MTLLLITRLYVHSVSPRRRETTCWSPVLHRRRRPSSPPSWQLSNQQCATMQRRRGEVTSTSLCPTPTDPAQSTLSMCFLHCFRYYSLVKVNTYTEPSFQKRPDLANRGHSVDSSRFVNQMLFTPLSKADRGELEK